MSAQYENIIRKAVRYWHEKNLEEYDYILLLPDEDKAFSERVRAAFNVKLQRCSDISGISIDGDAAMQLVMLYSLYNFSNSVLIGSFDEPYGRKLRNLLDSGVATEDELINDVILGVMDGKRV